MLCQLETILFSMPQLLKAGQDLLIGASTLILKLLDHVQKRTKLFVHDGKISNSIDSLKHRCNVACASLFYRYYKRFCSGEIKGLIAQNHVILRKTRLSRRAHPYVVYWPLNRTISYGQNSFFSRTERMQNSLRADLVIFFGI